MTHDPQRRSQEDPGEQPSMPTQRGKAQGTATISREQQARERAAPPLEHRPPKSHLPLKIAGLIGVLLLAGLIAGLVVSNTPTSTPAPTVHTVFKFGAHGPAISPSFVVRSSPVTSSYSYRCPAGVAGRFTANLVRSDGTDSHTIVDTTAPSVSGSTTIHPAHVGSLYHVVATAPAGCGYQINTVAP
jgi:hypothetical protein